MMEANNFIEFHNVSFRYDSADSGDGEDGENVFAVSGIDFAVKQGQFVGILGRNGSGKSTLAKLMNALLIPTSGDVYVNGMNTRDASWLWEIRKSVGMIFQNPDNQIVASTVEDDVAFGLENLGVPREEMEPRINDALSVVGLADRRLKEPHYLSGGQKQRLAIAGILAMRPSCIVLDESTAMLDPKGRDRIISIVRELNLREKITIILITHHMDEVVDCDRLFIIDKGRIIKSGTPGEIFSDEETVVGAGLELPPVCELFQRLGLLGLRPGETVLTKEAGVEFLTGVR